MQNETSIRDTALVYSVDAVRAIDRAATTTGNIAGYELMHRAASHALSVARADYPQARRWQILCGGGNNGGDGMVLARLAAAEGIDVQVSMLAEPATLAGDAAAAYRDLLAASGAPAPFVSALDLQAELLVDAMLGSGLARDVSGRYADAVAAINSHSAPVLALDLPSGLHGDTGAVLGCAVQADATVTFVGRKAGLYIADGPDHVGRLYFSDLDIPEANRAGITPVMRTLRPAAVRECLPRRRRQSHKGSYGHVLIVGGNCGMPGAVRLAGEAALRAGAGRVSIATHPLHAAFAAGSRPELMCHAIDKLAPLERLIDSATVILVGPGLGLTDWSRMLFDAVRTAGKSLVVDADALTLLAGRPDIVDDRVLTPHPGEAARLLATTAATIQSDRLLALSQLRSTFGGTIALKGCGTLVSCRHGLPWICLAGNPGMATAGTGDVLAGVVAGLRAQGLSADDAAMVAVDVHARAGDVAAAAGERGLLAGDLIEELRPWLNP